MLYEDIKKNSEYEYLRPKHYIHMYSGISGSHDHQAPGLPPRSPETLGRPPRPDNKSNRIADFFHHLVPHPQRPPRRPPKRPTKAGPLVPGNKPTKSDFGIGTLRKVVYKMKHVKKSKGSKASEASRGSIRREVPIPDSDTDSDVYVSDNEVMPGSDSDDSGKEDEISSYMHTSKLPLMQILYALKDTFRSGLIPSKRGRFPLAKDEEDEEGVYERERPIPGEYLAPIAVPPKSKTLPPLQKLEQNPLALELKDAVNRRAKEAPASYKQIPSSDPIAAKIDPELERKLSKYKARTETNETTIPIAESVPERPLPKKAVVPIPETPKPATQKPIQNSVTGPQALTKADPRTKPAVPSGLNKPVLPVQKVSPSMKAVHHEASTTTLAGPKPLTSPDHQKKPALMVKPFGVSTSPQSAPPSPPDDPKPEITKPSVANDAKVTEEPEYHTLSEVPADTSQLTTQQLACCLKIMNMGAHCERFLVEKIDGNLLCQLYEGGEDPGTMLNLNLTKLEAVKLRAFATDNWRPK